MLEILRGIDDNASSGYAELQISPDENMPRNHLSKILQGGQNSQIVGAFNDDNMLFEHDLRNECVNNAACDTQSSKSVQSVIPVNYGFLPAIVDQVEQHNSTGSDGSSCSGGEFQTYIERSRSLTRSLTPRRSKSRMRKIKIGRNESRKATALSIKSHNYFPTRERGNSYKHAVASSSDEEGSSQSHRKSELNSRKMSVQDAISIFENKQRDQRTGILKLSSATDIFVVANKTVLRRHTADMGDLSDESRSDAISEDSFQAMSKKLVIGDAGQILEVKPESEIISQSHDYPIAVSSESDEAVKEKSCNPIHTHVNHEAPQSERLTASAEWKRLKEAELESMMMQMVGSRPVKYGNVVPENGGKQLPYDQNYTRILEDVGKCSKKEAKSRAVKQSVDQNKKAEMISTNGLSKPCKSQKCIPSDTNLYKETLKISAAKKTVPKSSSLSISHKSWPSAPLTKTGEATPTRSPSGPKATLKGLQAAKQLIPQGALDENIQDQRLKIVKGIQSQSNKSSKCVKEKKLHPVLKGGKAIKSTVMSDEVFSSKVNKISSVVPIESKPFLRKGSGINRRVGSVTTKSKVSSQLKESPKNPEIFIECQEHKIVLESSEIENWKKDEGLVAQIIFDADLELLSQVNTLHDCDLETNDDQLIVVGEDTSKDIRISQLESEVEDELVIISPSAWVEIEEHPEVDIISNEIMSQLTSSADILPVGSSSPHFRQSLFQMNDESSDFGVTDWRNAENHPAMVYKKKVPKGLKRLLRFANARRYSDNLLRKSTPRAINYRPQNMPLSNSYDAQASKDNDHLSAAAIKTKATRSFFSLSTFKRSR